MAQETKTIDVTKLVRMKNGDATASEVESARVRNLIQALKKTVAPESWDCVGGAGALQSHFVENSDDGPKWFLIGFQTSANISEIERIVTALQG